VPLKEVPRLSNCRLGSDLTPEMLGKVAWWWSAYVWCSESLPSSAFYPYLAAFHGWSPCPFGSVSRLCASARLGGGIGKRSAGSVRLAGWVGTPVRV
jgi:hypothetical protein